MKKRLIALTVIISGFVLPLGAQAEIKVSDNFSIYGDGRARYEMDERTRLNAGVYEDQERDRMRYRLRLGFKYTVNDNVEFGARLTSGNPDANSPHEFVGGSGATTTGDKGFNKDPFSIDKAYVQGKYMDGWAWFGKNSMPLWKQNEYFWDDDVNPEGVAAGYTLKDLGPLSITVQGGSFTIKEDSWYADNVDNGDKTLGVYQGVVKAAFDIADITAAYGALTTSGGADVRYQNATTTAHEDYTIGSIEAKIKAIQDVGISVGYDIMKSDADKDDSGNVVSLGASYKAFWAALYLIDIEKNAVTAFAQDDWPNYFSDMKGFEARIGYKISKNMNVDIRRFDAEKDSDSEQEESRWQANFNVSF